MYNTDIYIIHLSVVSDLDTIEILSASLMQLPYNPSTVCITENSVFVCFLYIIAWDRD